MEMFMWEDLLAREPGRPPDDEGATPFWRPLRKAIARYTAKTGRPPTHIAVRPDDFFNLIVTTGVLPDGHFVLYEAETTDQTRKDSPTATAGD